MLKYVGIVKVQNYELLHQWHSGSTVRYYTSEIDSDKAKVSAWLESESTKHNDWGVSTSILIAFDDQKSINFEELLNSLS